MRILGRFNRPLRWQLGGLFLIFLTSACSPLKTSSIMTGPATGRIIDDVPFHAQVGRYDCGPAALASLLGQRGESVSLEEIRAATYTPSLRGSLLPDLENYARSLGYEARSGRGDLVLLRESIDADTPVLIPLEMGRWKLTRPHYVVVYGYAGSDFFVHGGRQGNLAIAARDLDRRWQKLNRLYLYLE